MALLAVLWGLKRVAGQGNHRCWTGQFTFERCCNQSLPEGDPDCFDKDSFTYRRCCHSPNEEIPEPTEPPKDPEASTRWRVGCLLDHLGGWMIHELNFFTDTNCSQPVRMQMGYVESSHRAGFPPKHAFDNWAGATDNQFWYSKEAIVPGTAFLGLELLKPARVRCVKLWHNNLPEVPVVLERWEEEADEWIEIQRWASTLGGEYVNLSVAEPLQSRVQRDHEFSILSEDKAANSNEL